MPYVYAFKDIEQSYVNACNCIEEVCTWFVYSMIRYIVYCVAFCLIFR